MAVASLPEVHLSSTDQGPRLVAIGGGTGMPSLLRGLTHYTTNITAIVTVADDGGSSGRLRREFGLLPPGDFRSNIAALSRDEELMTQLLHYRFGGGISGRDDQNRELQGHAFGNLLLAALTGITGSFDEALLAAQRVLAMRGRVVPSTLADVNLLADVFIKDETDSSHLQRIAGESAITHAGGRIQRVYLDPARRSRLSACSQGYFPGANDSNRTRQSLHQHLAQSACPRSGSGAAACAGTKALHMQYCHPAG